MKVPYRLVAATGTEQRHAQMARAVEKGFPRLTRSPIVDGRSISIACYGPSLADTWRDLTRPIITVSGALHFLAERGVVPDYHVDVDPRPHKVKHLQPAVDGVHYLMASVCPTATWDALRGQRVSLFHVYSDPTTEAWIRLNDPGAEMIRPGSNAGLAAIHVGGVLGYRHFEIHGMDGSIREGKRHAGPHYGHPQGGIEWTAGHVKYQTSRIMANGCSEMINSLRVFPIFAVFHGEGLQQALIEEEYDLDNAALAGTPKANMVRAKRVLFEIPADHEVAREAYG